jgi:hypothetical protein
LNILYALLLGIIPAILVVGITGRIHDSVSRDKNVERQLITLLGALVVSLTTLVITASADNRTASFVYMMLLPVTCGILASITLRFFSNRVAGSRRTPRILLLSLIAITLLVLLGITGDLTAPLIITIGGVFLALVWRIWGWMGRKVLLTWSIQMVLLCVSIWAADAHTPLIESPGWLSGTLQIAVWGLIPAMAVTTAASLLFGMITQGLAQGWSRILFISTLIVSIFYLVGFQIFTASVWDVATDGLGGIILWMLTSVSGIAVAMLMAWKIPGKRVLITIVFAILLPLSMRYALWLGSHVPDGEWGESPAYITARRAEKVAAAIGRFYAEHGYYPQSLDDLFPKILVYIPRPIMIPGQAWCYEGGGDNYRFGYVYRQYFSTPASVVIHTASGQPANHEWPCEVEAAKYPAPPGYDDP